MSVEEVYYKGVKCKIIWNYGNGQCEILLFDDIVLVNESDLTIIDLNANDEVMQQNV